VSLSPAQRDNPWEEKVALDAQYYALLEKCLQDDYVPHLPPLMDQTKPADQQQKKNLSRAFSAFALRAILREFCDLPAADCAKAVVDDFEDNGIDAAHYHAADETLYLIQAKLKASEMFAQDEALAFCQGVKKFVRQEFDSFNQHVKNRQAELEDAVESCSRIVLVVAHIGSGISTHADTALKEFLADKDAEDDRLVSPYEDFDSAKSIKALQAVKAIAKVNADLTLHKCKSIAEPRDTYFGVIPLADLVALHNAHGTGLYDRNIRTYLGHRTDVNTSIRETLATAPENFLYLNNGVTMLADIIDPKAVKSEGRKLKMRGVSVINGAQTIATAAESQTDTPPADLSKAKVMLTIVRAGSDSDFGKAVTRARNHQNPVVLANFAALDDEQERLRRELAVLGFQYYYKAGAADAGYDPKRIRIEEAAQALAMLHADPRYAIRLKKEPGDLLDTSKPIYRELFDSKLSGLRLANAVLVNRYAHSQMRSQETHATGQTRTIYKHTPFVVAWILLKQTRDEVKAGKLLTEEQIRKNLGIAFDGLRESCLQVIQGQMQSHDKGALAICRNQGETLPLMRDCMIRHFGNLANDPAVIHKMQQQSPNEPYPKQLFDYLVSKAPQIGNLA
jgi:hypothetical protein